MHFKNKEINKQINSIKNLNTSQVTKLIIRVLNITYHTYTID
jgi:hypothetical protein